MSTDWEARKRSMHGRLIDAYAKQRGIPWLEAESELGIAPMAGLTFGEVFTRTVKGFVRLRCDDEAEVERIAAPIIASYWYKNDNERDGWDISFDIYQAMQEA
jgi:hypothetical protein